jgi:hypothetical protein
MRVAAWLLLPAVALLLLAAHLFHNGAQVLALLPLAMIALLALRRAWAARLVQVTLLVATIEWGLTAAVLAQARMAQGAPYVRLVAILGAVALFTALAALAFQRAPMQAWFRLGRPTQVAPSGTMPD